MADRIEREIEEILRKIDDFVPETGKPRRQPRKPAPGAGNAQGWLGRRLASVSLNHVMLWALLLFVAAFFLRGLPAASWLMLAALIVCATAFMLSLRAPRQRNVPKKRWRGEPVDDSGPRWPDRVKAWLKGRKRA